MSLSKPTTARALRQRNPTDRFLGCFSNVQPSPRLDHLIRYLSTWSGTDKVRRAEQMLSKESHCHCSSCTTFPLFAPKQALMLTQYSSKLLIAFLTLQHAMRIRLRHGTKSYHAIHGGSSLAKKVENLAGLVSDARVLYRIWGILPIVKWVSGEKRGRW